MSGLPDEITLTPCPPVHATIQPPGSKSITNRALVCAALARGTSTLTGALDSDDTRVMIDSLRRLGIDVTCADDNTTLYVPGCGGQLPAEHAELYVGNSGTTIRFLTALVTLGHGHYRLDGVPRMRQRPIADLLDGLKQIGADARSELQTGAPPVVVVARGLRGGTTTVSGTISSQFLSGILMAAPYAEQDVTVQVDGELVSKPYVAMTLQVMESFGATVGRENWTRFHIPAPQSYAARHYAIEPDASAASYFWAAAAITGGQITVTGLSRDALQGDVAFCDCLQRMGCQVDYGSDQITVRGPARHGIDIDMNPISDTVQTLAAVALFVDGATRIRGVAHIRHKETDRIGDLARELRKLGAQVQEDDDGLTIQPGPLRPARIATYDDHRMAMSLSLVGLRQPEVTILDPGCTAKTYPQFFDDLERIMQQRA